MPNRCQVGLGSGKIINPQLHEASEKLSINDIVTLLNGIASPVYDWEEFNQDNAGIVAAAANKGDQVLIAMKPE